MASMKASAMPCLAGAASGRVVEGGVDVAGADVLADAQLVAREVLEDDADAAAQGQLVPLLQVKAVEQDAAGGRGVEAREQLDQRGLAGAVLADQGEGLAVAQVKLTRSRRGWSRRGR
jgi:hypothetical protein